MTGIVPLLERTEGFATIENWLHVSPISLLTGSRPDPNTILPCIG